MKNLKIVTSVFLKATIEAFPQIFKDICDAIVANSTIFTVIPYSAAELNTFWQDMVSKTAAANEGSKADRDARDLQRTICNNVLLALAGAVITRAMQASSEQEAVGIVNLSKFTLAKNPQPLPPVTQVEGVKGTWTGIYGQAQVEWNRQPIAGVVSYNVYTCLSQPQNPESWVFAGTTTRKKFTLNDLPNLGQVYVQVVAVKDGVNSAPSEPVMVGIAAI